jgi:hypothetical protein
MYTGVPDEPELISLMLLEGKKENLSGLRSIILMIV